MFEASPLIAQLPERQRLVVFLRYYAGLGLGIGANTVPIGTSYACVTKSAAATYVWM